MASSAQFLLKIETAQREMTVPGSGSDMLIGVVEVNRDFMVAYDIDSDDITLKVGLRSATDSKVSGVSDVECTEVDGSLSRFYRFLVTIPTGTTVGDYFAVAYIDETIETDSGDIKSSKISAIACPVILK